MVDNHDVVWLVWNEKKQQKKIKVAELMKRANKYYFKYDIDGVKEAMKYDLVLLPCFSHLNAEYSSDKLFPIFSTRLPDPKRKDIGMILGKYGLNSYDEFELIKKSGAKLPTDPYEFIQPKAMINAHSDDFRRRKPTNQTRP